MTYEPIYSSDYLHAYLSQVCEFDKQKLKQKVVQDLIFEFQFTEFEAEMIWEEGVNQKILTHINFWEKNEQYFFYKYNPKI